MIGLGPLSFAVPWALTALIALPAIWWLLRLKPLAPTRIPFSSVFILRRLPTREESPANTPIWLLFLRMLLAAAVIVAAARPMLSAESPLHGRGPIYVIIDDGWAAAANWPARQAMLLNLADQADRADRPFAVITTAAAAGNLVREPVQLVASGVARRLFDSLQPKPWGTDRRAALKPLTEGAAFADERPGDVVWLSDGIEEPGTNMEARLGAIVRPLQRLGATVVLSEKVGYLPVVLRPPAISVGGLSVTAERSTPAAETLFWVRAIATDGQLLARKRLLFGAGARQAEAEIELPVELLNRMARLELEGVETAASVVLLDERWRRRPVGLVSAGGAKTAQPFLNEIHYLERALMPFTEVRRSAIDELLDRELAVLVLADPGPLDEGIRRRLTGWLEDGGVILRFAGPRLAQETAVSIDPLLPVRLRQGNRVIGGAMSWQRPESLAAFDKSSLFHGLDIPGDIKVNRQVLAQPSLDLADKTWARLTDGTPLITFEQRGRGWLVLVHTTANAEWSNLPISGLFVDILRRVVGLSQGVAARASGPPLAPLATMDGFGRLGPPLTGTSAVPADVFNEQMVSPAHPPGYYGKPEVRRALNLSAALLPVEPIEELPAGAERRGYETAAAFDLQPWLFVLALVLLLIDMAVSMALRGLLRALRVGALALSVALTAGAAEADTGDDAAALDNSLETRLAYVITGDDAIDEISRAGLVGLNVMLRRRTAAELGPPQGVNPAVDELAFFPLIYWPLTPVVDTLSATAAIRINAYLRNGGTILFDTRDQSASAEALAWLAHELDIPPLVPVPPNHVLTRAFYLMREFPGRWAGSTLWVERVGERVNDGVSSVIVGGHDWTAAWAMDEAQHPFFPVVPGGERQREMAFRFGINLVMYTLTGNYKADQVHLPAILRRLGQ